MLIDLPLNRWAHFYKLLSRDALQKVHRLFFFIWLNLSESSTLNDDVLLCSFTLIHWKKKRSERKRFLSVHEHYSNRHIDVSSDKYFGLIILSRAKRDASKSTEEKRKISGSFNPRTIFLHRTLTSSTFNISRTWQYCYCFSFADIIIEFDFDDGLYEQGTE